MSNASENRNLEVMGEVAYNLQPDEARGGAELDRLESREIPPALSPSIRYLLVAGRPGDLGRGRMIPVSFKMRTMEAITVLAFGGLAWLFLARHPYRYLFLCRLAAPRSPMSCATSNSDIDIPPMALPSSCGRRVPRPIVPDGVSADEGAPERTDAGSGLSPEMGESHAIPGTGAAEDIPHVVGARIVRGPGSPSSWTAGRERQDRLNFAIGPRRHARKCDTGVPRCYHQGPA